jgi:hypothetical protein
MTTLSVPTVKESTQRITLGPKIPCPTPPPRRRPPSPRWSVERRLDFITSRLTWEGRINRLDLVARFGVSPNQASADLKRLRDPHSDVPRYDTRAKTYRAGPALPAPEVEILEQNADVNGGLTARARLRFATVVEGPILLGVGSHFGDGLFVAQPV